MTDDWITGVVRCRCLLTVYTGVTLWVHPALSAGGGGGGGGAVSMGDSLTAAQPLPQVQGMWEDPERRRGGGGGGAGAGRQASRKQRRLQQRQLEEEKRKKKYSQVHPSEEAEGDPMDPVVYGMTATPKGSKRISSSMGGGGDEYEGEVVAAAGSSESGAEGQRQRAESPTPGIPPPPFPQPPWSPFPPHCLLGWTPCSPETRFQHQRGWLAHPR